MTLRTHSRTLAGIAALTCALAVGCTNSSTTYADGARSTLYDSVQQLSRDSVAAVVATVADQQVVGKDSETTTLSTIKVAEVTRDGFGTNLPSGQAGFPQGTPVVVVRQLGGPDIQGPAPMLEVGRSYLLFLTPTMLPGEDGAQFYITGGSAGYYAAPQGAALDAKASFTKVGDEGDRLPGQITLAQAASSSL